MGCKYKDLVTFVGSFGVLQLECGMTVVAVWLDWPYGGCTSC